MASTLVLGLVAQTFGPCSWPSLHLRQTVTVRRIYLCMCCPYSLDRSGLNGLEREYPFLCVPVAS